MTPQLSRTLKILLGLHVGIWLIGQVIAEGYLGVRFTSLFALFPAKFLYQGFLWQPLTYMFLHSLQIGHIFFNMLMLVFVGYELEMRWGSRRFILFYILSGVGAGILYSAAIWLSVNLWGVGATGLVAPVVGASGAIFGLLLAYGVIFGDRVVQVMFFFPMKAKVFVMILGTIELLTLLTQGIGSDVAHLAHLGGILSGYILLQIFNRFDRMKWAKGIKKKNSNLRLVVDNDRKPRYWN